MTDDSGVDTAALTALAASYVPRPIRPLGVWELEGRLVKSYRITAPGRHLDPALTSRARELARGQLAVDRLAGGLGLAVAIVHPGGDGDYVVLQSWIEGYMSRLALFSGPPDQPELLRPAPAGLAPCVWELAVLAHERDALQRHLLSSTDPAACLPRWLIDTLSTDT